MSLSKSINPSLFTRSGLDWDIKESFKIWKSHSSTIDWPLALSNYHNPTIVASLPSDQSLFPNHRYRQTTTTWLPSLGHPVIVVITLKLTIVIGQPVDHYRWISSQPSLLDHRTTSIIEPYSNQPSMPDHYHLN